MSKKNKIIETTKELIHSKGYQATTINDVLEAAEIGKGQFYHYFSSKHDLGLAVVHDLVDEWNHQLVINILQSSKKPKEKLCKMLDWALCFHNQTNSGCPIGNLALEMSEHDEEFRIKIDEVFHHWIYALKNVLDEMIERGELKQDIDTEKYAQAIVAMIEGAILLKKNKQDMQILINIIEVIRAKFQLSH
ncbi:TetR/AcrR family transcriptional regulator [Aneurinibacillus sp. Ricciae_BoGa-3]|uniref:TetR/AcrR family transcriptional regulator n=1 Tax=Aneurinibacillus sp. Ricciae_BoGa-3 TaxID=3022697 RepID=UPI0023414129|nr:TetR/AcrR family transcriptional regulator [Aneurinibacillus sp. Ricciae_BoGa-3]WCK52991.1 TetR/AcrR family transcriptional regulator [Aneurinibacillus sp. Ricciae_BoGa-3]